MNSKKFLPALFMAWIAVSNSWAAIERIELRVEGMT